MTTGRGRHNDHPLGDYERVRISMERIKDQLLDQTRDPSLTREQSDQAALRLRQVKDDINAIRYKHDHHALKAMMEKYG